MENSGKIRYKFDKKIGGYVAVIARAINGGIDIPPLYNDGKNGEHPVVEIGNEAFALSDAKYVRIPESMVKIFTFRKIKYKINSQQKGKDIHSKVYLLEELNSGKELAL